MEAGTQVGKSTSRLSAWLEPHSHPSFNGLAPIDHLFNKFDGLYPGKWRALFANKQAIENWRREWSEGFVDEAMTAAEIRSGIRACRERFEWPPSFKEFFGACRPQLDHSAALLEAIEQMQRRASDSDTWSHPAIYWAAASIGSYEMLNRSTKELEPLWRRAFVAQMAKGEWPAIPKRAPALPAPGQQHTEAHAKKVMAEMMAKLRKIEAAE